MRQLYKIIAILLCVSLLLSFTGCVENEVDPTLQAPTAAPTAPPTEPTVPTETDPTAPPPTEPQIPAAYHQAMDALENSNDLTMTVTTSRDMDLGTQTFTAQSTQCITWLGLGTQQMRAQVDETALYGPYETKITELFADGTLYSNVFGQDFTCEITPENFTARYIPVVPIHSELYGAFTVETTEDAVTVQFTDGTAPESWLMAEDAQWVSGNATAQLTPDGQMQRIEYTATYRYGNVDVTTSVKIDYAAPAVSEIKAPTNLKNYLTFSNPDAPRVIEQIYGYLNDYDYLSFSTSTTTIVDAAGLYMLQGSSFDSYGTGNKVQAKIKSSAFISDGYSNKTQDMDLEELFINGKYTISTNGGLPEANRSVNADLINDYIFNTLTKYVLDWSYFEEATCTDLGSLLFYEFTGSDELAKLIDSQICQEVFNDPELLSGMASKYKADKIVYYIAVDKYLGLPTALGLDYKGTYTIDGQKYSNTRQVDQQICLGSMSAYAAIHDTSSPDTKPENPATPLFYHVTGPNGQEMWLLGTIHVGDNRTGYLPQEIYDAYNASDALAVECNTRAFEKQSEQDKELQEEISQAYVYTDGSTTESHISDKALYQKALMLMKATGNYQFSLAYAKVSLWTSAINSFFTKQYYTLASDKGVDYRLLLMAEADGKTILEVESAKDQMLMDAGWSDRLSEFMLEEATMIHGLEYYAELQEMYELWCAGDEEALIAMINTDPGEMTEDELKLYNEYHKAMQWDRDEGMVETAIEYLESGDVVFYAVGLAHVLAEDGLVNSLREAGYTVEAVEYNG